MPRRSTTRTVLHDLSALVLPLLLILAAPLSAPASTENATALASRAGGLIGGGGDAGVSELTPVPVPEASPLALRFYQTGQWLWALRTFWRLAVPGILLFSGASAALAALARRVGRAWFPTVGCYVALYLAVVFLLDLPLDYYTGFVRQHAYGLSNQRLQKWWTDSLTELAIAIATGFLFAWVPFFLIARRPRRWWFYTTLLTVPFVFGVVLIKPVWIDPLFNDFGPMKDRALEARIRAMADRAGIEGGRIYEVNKSVDTHTSNAYVTGVLGTKRIVLWDTLLNQLEPREVLAVMGHEMGHYVLGHVPRSVVLSSLVTLTSLFWIDRAGRALVARFHGQFGFERLSDVAALPLILLLLSVASLALAPVVNAYSRHQEHEADRFALEVTRTNRSAALAFVKIQKENLVNPRPGLFYRLWRATHPSIGDRIDFCNAYHPWVDGRPLRYQALLRR